MPKNSAPSVHLLLLHGWVSSPDTKKKWQPLIDLLEEKDIVSHFLQLPGLDTTLKTPWSLDNYADWLKKELAKTKKKMKKGQKIGILGHSFGGQIATRYAAKHPNSFDFLILVDSGGLRDHGLIAETKRFVFGALAKIGNWFFSSLRLPPEKIKKLLYKAARENDYLEASPVQKKIMSQILADETWHDLGKIHEETLILWGEKDTVTPPVFGEIFAELIPSNTLVWLPEARHSPIYTHPETVAKKVAEFIGKKS
jgi:pimeloyl-ACP methyl ester carboxylesterase